MAMLVLFLVVTAALLACSLLLRPVGEDSGRPPLDRLREVLRRQWVPMALVLAMAAMAVLSFDRRGGGVGHDHRERGHDRLCLVANAPWTARRSCDGCSQRACCTF